MIPTNLELPSLTEQHTTYASSVHDISSAKYINRLTACQPFLKSHHRMKMSISPSFFTKILFYAHIFFQNAF